MQAHKSNLVMVPHSCQVTNSTPLKCFVVVVRRADDLCAAAAGFADQAREDLLTSTGFRMHVLRGLAMRMSQAWPPSYPSPVHG